MLKTENRFSGIPTIIAAMKKAKLSAPVFQSKGGVFKVILFNGEEKPVSKAETEGSSNKIFQNRVREFCKVPRSREELAKEFNFGSQYYMITRYIQP